MAAYDAFEHFNSTLPQKVRSSLQELIRIRTGELLAARSEDARARLVESYIEELHELLETAKK